MAEGKEFSWANIDHDELVVETVRATAVYLNANGQVVIRQERDWNEEEDTILVLPLESAEKLAKKLPGIVKKLKAIKAE